MKAGALFMPEPLSAQSSYLIVLEKCSNQIWENFEEVLVYILLLVISISLK